MEHTHTQMLYQEERSLKAEDEEKKGTTGDTIVHFILSLHQRYTRDREPQTIGNTK